MSSLFAFQEDNGTAVVNPAGTPATGTTRTLNRTECNWKNIDDSTTAYSSSPITAGNNSFRKYQYGVITGTFNQILNGKFGHTTGIFGAGLQLLFSGTTGYATPSTSALTSPPAVDITLSSGIAASSQTMFFSQVGPERAASASQVVTGYTNYFLTQLLTTVSASPGDTATATLTLQYDEN